MTQTTLDRYTGDFKSQAVDLAESIGRMAVARKLGISTRTLDNLLQLARDGKLWSSTDRKTVSGHEGELARLRAENAGSRMEHEIQRKVTAFFAKESK